jgi:hypothetical protein
LGTAYVGRPYIRVFCSFFNSTINFTEERTRCRGASFLIPLGCRLRFSNRLRMDVYLSREHYDPEILFLASDQGISLTLPPSISLRRRRISASHADSVPWSTVSSRLSSKVPARAARASGGSFSASFKMSEIFSFMPLFYLSFKQNATDEERAKFPLAISAKSSLNFSCIISVALTRLPLITLPGASSMSSP